MKKTLLVLFLAASSAYSQNIPLKVASNGTLSEPTNFLLGVSNGGSGVTSTSQNNVFAGPTSGSGAPTWRQLVSGDIPSLLSVYAPATAGSSILYANGSGGFSNVTVGTGLSFSAGTLTATTNGTVTSVGVIAPAFLTVTGSPVTASGNITLSYSGTAIPYSSGGTNSTTALSAFQNFYSTIATTLGDIVYGGASGTPTRLAGSTSATSAVLTQTGNGTVSAAPVWSNSPAFSGANLTSLNASNLSSGTVAAARLPYPTTSTIGGVMAVNSTSNQWVSYIDTGGVPHTSQPSFSNISGTATATQLPTSGVTAGTYGSSTTVPQITFDTYGRATGVTNVSIGGGSVTNVSVTSANGFAGTVATSTSTPNITLSTTVTGLLKGNGTAISAATAGTDYMTPSNVSGSYLALGGGTLTGGLTGTTGTFSGLLAQGGTLGFSGTGIGLQSVGNTNSYYQSIIQNLSSGNTASSDLVVCNNLSTDSTYYGDLGMNSSTFAGSGALNAANAVYLSSTSGDLAIGTTTSNAIHFVINGGTTDAATINTSGQLVLPAFSTAGIVINSASGVLSSTTAPTISGANISAINASNISTGTVAAARLPTSGITAGTYGSSSVVPVITFDQYGRATAVSNATISGGGGGISNITMTVPAGLTVSPTSLTANGTFAVTTSGTRSANGVVTFDGSTSINLGANTNATLGGNGGVNLGFQSGTPTAVFTGAGSYVLDGGSGTAFNGSTGFNANGGTININSGTTTGDGSGNYGIGGTGGTITMIGGSGVYYGGSGASNAANAGSIVANGGNSWTGGTLVIYGGGTGGTLNMSGSNATSGGAGTNGGSINTTAGGNLTMGSGNLTGTNISGSIQTREVYYKIGSPYTLLTPGNIYFWTSNTTLNGGLTYYVLPNASTSVINSSTSSGQTLTTTIKNPTTSPLNIELSSPSESLEGASPSLVGSNAATSGLPANFNIYASFIDPNGNAYLAGASSTNAPLVYEVASGTTTATQMVTSGLPSSMIITCLNSDGTNLIMGGYDGSTYSPYLYGATLNTVGAASDYQGVTGSGNLGSNFILKSVQTDVYGFSAELYVFGYNNSTYAPIAKAINISGGVSLIGNLSGLPSNFQIQSVYGWIDPVNRDSDGNPRYVFYMAGYNHSTNAPLLYLSASYGQSFDNTGLSTTNAVSSGFASNVQLNSITYTNGLNNPGNNVNKIFIAGNSSTGSPYLYAITPSYSAGAISSASGLPSSMYITSILNDSTFSGNSYNYAGNLYFAGYNSSNVPLVYTYNIRSGSFTQIATSGMPSTFQINTLCLNQFNNLLAGGSMSNTPYWYQSYSPIITTISAGGSIDLISNGTGWFIK